MASYGHGMSAAASRHAQPAAFGAAAMQLAGAAAGPAGTFASGTKIQVGSHRVVIQKYLSEGGFAHVYLVKLPKAVDGTDLAVLKRVAVPDKEALRGMRTEVETMKRLKGHAPIVTYIDSHASELRGGGGGYEVFLLMEYCNGGGLIDFMNTRLQHRLTEPEILTIFTDIAEGVACMHYLKPPLLHRDLKVENVLITAHASSKRFKLCDFGSAAPPRAAPTTVAECRATDEDVQKHTTMQYRSPEMVDVYRKLPIDEKSDIWALGVLLYKLCYYTTPFEDQGQLAILNASYKYPSYPAFSDRLKHLIASMLRENQQSRPNIYQVLKEGCAMQGRDVPIKDIYSGRPQPDASRAEKARATDPRTKSSPVVGAVFSPPVQQQPSIPEVVPMRRGRPTATPSAGQPSPKPGTSPGKITNGDPFAALDTKSSRNRSEADELSSRFPTLDQFSLLHDQGAKFDFDSPTSPAGPTEQGGGQTPSERLAEEVFASSLPKSFTPVGGQSNPSDINRARPMPAQVTSPLMPPKAAPVSASPKPAEVSRAQEIISKSPELQAISNERMYQSTTPKPTMVSTGTMTSTPPTEATAQRPNQFPGYRFPSSDHSRSASVPRQQDIPASAQLRPDISSPRPVPVARGSSFQAQPTHMRHSSSSRPSLEGGRPEIDLSEPMTKSKSISGRPRPPSTYLESNMDYLREKEGASKATVPPGLQSPALVSLEHEDEMNIESNVDFLRSMEDSEPKKREKKRASLPSLSGTKNIFAGKFGDAFKRFESSNAPLPRTPSPLKDLERRDLTPIEGSEATDGRSDDGKVAEEDMTPEMRREMERRRDEEEERRVAAAAAEYRQRVNRREGLRSPSLSLSGPEPPVPPPKSIGGVSRAVSIQNRVQNLLDESSRSSGNVRKTAEGYGHFTDVPGAPVKDAPVAAGKPAVPRKPTGGPLPPGKPAPPAPPVSSSVNVGARSPSLSLSQQPQPQPQQQQQRAPSDVRPVPAAATGGRPAAPPKPVHLNKPLPPGGRAGSPPKNVGAPLSAKERLVAGDMSPAEKDEYIRDFSKRFPSLTSIEMVERDVGPAEGSSGR